VVSLGTQDKLACIINYGFGMWVQLDKIMLAYVLGYYLYDHFKYCTAVYPVRHRTFCWTSVGETKVIFLIMAVSVSLLLA